IGPAAVAVRNDGYVEPWSVVNGWLRDGNLPNGLMGHEHVLSPPRGQAMQTTLYCKARSQKILPFSLRASRESGLPYDSGNAPAPVAPLPSIGIRFLASARRMISCTRCNLPLPVGARARSGCRPWSSAALSVR